MTTLFRFLSALITLLGAASSSLAIWFGLPLIGHPLLAQDWVRAALIGCALSVLALQSMWRRRKRKNAAIALEQSLISTKVGDGAIVAERMKGALKRLKKIGGATSLYDLPWYVLIGPPGAGKTTALIHSGLEFPGTDPGSVAGFGGTKNCDFWFTREAVMIDTAGRYTTQDSDAEADKISWLSFLNQLKGARPDQPINGVILAFSCEDMMTARPDELEAHARIVRTRLAELHETLKTHIPVYVIFTKADMISGFRQYFGSFDAERRKVVWGVTFQTKDRKEETHRAVSREFSQLVARLSHEVTDRLNEEVDSATRISIFGFPEQLSLMDRNITIFLQRIFDTPQKTRAILRGFYFTSGTQEGTPIDQVLGAMSNHNGAGALQPGFMSGRGRSYFLHDLLKKVIFEERDWVGYDRLRMLRRTLFRGIAKSLIATACIGAMGLVGYSFWSNATLIRQAALQTSLYEERARTFLQKDVIEDSETRPLLPALAAVRTIPSGYANPRPQEFVERLGLSRRDSLRGAAIQAYSDSLEKLLRPRMMVFMENRLVELIKENRYGEAYHALKIYILLAKEQDGRADDLAIQTYFSQAWAKEYSGPGSDADYRAINTHLAAMLELDDRVSPWIKPNKALVDQVREKAPELPLAVQAYSAIRSQAGALAPLSLVEHLGTATAQRVFQTTDQRPLDALIVNGMFTHEGYWNMFLNAVADAPTQLERDQWVLGTLTQSPDYNVQLATLSEDLTALYAQEFVQVWQAILSKIELAPVAVQAQEFPILAIVASDVSPLLKLSEIVATQTNLTLPPGGNSPVSATPQPALDQIAEAFGPWWHLFDGVEAKSPLNELRGALTAQLDAAQSQQGEELALENLQRRAGSVPDTLARFIEQILEDFATSMEKRSLTRLKTALHTDIIPYCEEHITSGYPFAPANTLGISLETFSAFFGYDGKMDRFFETHPLARKLLIAQGQLLATDDGVSRDPFNTADAIKNAFFQKGARTPYIPFTMGLIATSSGVTAIDISIGDEVTRLQSGAAPMPIIWPSPTNDISVTLLAADSTSVGSIQFSNTPWAAFELMTRGNQVVNENQLDVTHTAGAHTVTFRIGFEDATLPPLTRALAEFSCPAALE